MILMSEPAMEICNTDYNIIVIVIIIIADVSFSCCLAQ